jgi:tRNA pseudouridine-54 N-methylase
MLFPHNITIEVRGDAVESLNPDERTMALHLQRTLLAGNTVNSTHFKLLESNSSLLRENGGPPDTYNPNKPGAYTKSQKASFRIARRHREAMIRRVYRMVNETGEPSGFMLHRNDTLQKRLRMLKSREEQEGGIDMTSCNTFMLDEMGDPLVHVLPSNNNDESKSSAKATTNIILGDQMGYSPDDEMLLSENKDVKKVSLGPISLLTSHCITIVHNCLDIQQWNN